MPGRDLGPARPAARTAPASVSAAAAEPADLSAAWDDLRMEIVDAGRFLPAADGTARYAEQLRVPALSVGTYSIPAGAADDQEPHAEDEIYVVLSGRGAFSASGRTINAGPAGRSSSRPVRTIASTTSPRT